MTAASAPLPADVRRTRRAVFGGSFGFFVDMFDVYLPTVALAPAINYFTPQDMPASTKSIVTALIFVATLLGRPVGSAIFGPLADKVGRRRVTLWAVTGCGICTLLIAVLPGYHQAGLTGVVLMIVLRLIDGVFMGGEYTGATPLAMEASPNGRRGWYGGIVGAGFAFAYCAIALVTLLVLQFAPEGGPTSAYSVWGWRIPFVVGAVLCAVFLVWYARQVDESPAWQAAKKVRNPVREVILGRSARDYLQVFVMMTGVWFASNMASGLLPTALKSEGHVSATEVTGAIVIAQAIHTVMFPFLGEWSERVGRRVFLAWNGVAVGVVCALAFASLAAGWWSGFGLVLLLTVVIRLSGGSMFAITPSYLSERFPAAIRGTGFGLGYSGPLLITSFYAYYQDWLGHLMPTAYTPVVLLVIGGICMVTGALMGPETRSVDFSADAEEADDSAGVAQASEAP
jgi:MFS family permease